MINGVMKRLISTLNVFPWYSNSIYILCSIVW